MTATQIHKITTMSPYFKQMKIHSFQNLFVLIALCVYSTSAFAQNHQSAHSPYALQPFRAGAPYARSDGADAVTQATQLVNSARQFTLMGRKLDAIDMAMRAARLAPTWDAPPLIVAMNLMDIGRWDDAVKYCRSAIALNDSNEDAFATLTAIYFRADMPEAIPAGKDYLNKFPSGKYNDILQMQLDEARKFGTGSQKTAENYLHRAAANGKFRWQASSMPLKVFVATESGGSSNYDLEQRVCQSFRQWQANAGGFVSFVFVPDAKQADIECRWSERANANTAVAYAPGARLLDWESGGKQQEGFSEVQLGRGCITHAYINLRKPDSALDRLKALDMVQLSALHEIGHSLGLLEHSEKNSDVLCESANRAQYAKRFEPKLTDRDANSVLALYRQEPQQYNIDTRYSMDLDRPVGVGYAHCPTIDELLGYPAPLKISAAVAEAPVGRAPTPEAAALYRKAESRWADDDAIGALKLAAEASTADKQWHKPHLLMSMTLKQLGDLNRALQESLIALKLGSFDQEVWLRTVGVLLKGKLFEEVLFLGNRFSQRFPSSTDGQKEMLQLMAVASQRIALRNGTAHSGRGSEDYLDLATAEGRYRWPVSRMPLKVFIADGTGNPLYNPEFKGRLLRSFDQWQQAANGQITWRFVDTPAEADVECNWIDNRTDSKDQLRVAVKDEPVQNVVRGTINHGWISLILWSTRSQKKISPEALELQALQQVGHVLGILGRSASVVDVMYNHAGTDFTEPHLSSRDRRTIQMLYSDSPTIGAIP